LDRSVEDPFRSRKTQQTGDGLSGPRSVPTLRTPSKGPNKNRQVRPGAMRWPARVPPSEVPHRPSAKDLVVDNPIFNFPMD
jgi:hypothetical protein